MEKLRIWPMVASALVVLSLTFALTPPHSIARVVGYCLFGLAAVLLAIMLFGGGLLAPAHSYYRLNRSRLNRYVVKRRRQQIAFSRSRDMVCHAETAEG